MYRSTWPNVGVLRLYDLTIIRKTGKDDFLQFGIQPLNLLLRFQRIKDQAALGAAQSFCNGLESIGNLVGVPNQIGKQSGNLGWQERTALQGRESGFDQKRSQPFFAFSTSVVSSKMPDEGAVFVPGKRHHQPFDALQVLQPVKNLPAGRLPRFGQ